MTEEEIADRGAPHMTGEDVAERRTKCRAALKLGDQAWLYFEEIERNHRPVDAAGHPVWVETVAWRPRGWWPDDQNDWDEKENQKHFAEWMLEVDGRTIKEECVPECYEHQYALRWSAARRETGSPGWAAEPVHWTDGDGELEFWL